MVALRSRPSRIRQRLATAKSTPLRLLVNAALRWATDGSAQSAAAIAFHALFALAAALLLAVAIGGALFGPDAVRGQIATQIQGLVGADAALGVGAAIESAWRYPHAAVAGALGAIALVAGAAGLSAQLRRTLDRIGGVVPPPSKLGESLRRRAVAFALVLGFGFLALASLLLSAAAATAAASLGTLSGLPPPAVAALLDVAASTSVFALVFAALLHRLPHSPPSRGAVWAGAVCSALLFAVGKHLVWLCLARAGVASGHGVAISLVAAMAWVYVSAHALLFGAALAAVFDDERRGRLAGSHPQPVPGTAPTRPKASPAAPTSLAAVRSSRRAPSLNVPARSTANGAWKGSGQLLMFPGGRDKR